jgi:hypothetical protein
MKVHQQLPHPFPRALSPDRRPRIPIYAAYPYTLSSLPPDHYRRIIVQIFTEFYAAHEFLRTFTLLGTTTPNAPHPVTIIDSHNIILPHIDVHLSTRPYGPRPVTITSVLNYTPTPSEQHYRLPISVQRQPPLLIRPWHTPLLDAPPAPSSPTPPAPSSPTPTPTSRPHAHTTLAQSGRVHVSHIASQLTPPITAREARQALRQSKTPKPQGGWWFPTEDIPRITDIIRSHLKSPPSSTPSSST